MNCPQCDSNQLQAINEDGSNLFHCTTCGYKFLNREQVEGEDYKEE